MKNKTIINKAGETRLDVFLVSKLKITRSQVQKMIDENKIEINGKTPKKYGEKVKEGDKVSLKHENIKTLKQKPATITQEDKPVAEAQIIAETPDYIVVNKPTGLLTHPTQANEKESLAAWLIKKYTEIKKVGEDEMRPGIVHRLDKEASGLMVIARTQKMFEHLKNQFKERTINKEYLVLVHGKVEREEGVIDFPISRSDTAEKMAAVPETVHGQPTEIGKEAKTEFWVEKHFVNFTLLRVKIHTGRTHQIRVHMFAYNHPVVGDPMYFQRKQKRVWDEKCGRLFLHSTKLGFTNLDGEQVEYESPLPNELNNFLDKLS
jgi:23S rRNA pseudouridine1911/1915/1917 synthase